MVASGLYAGEHQDLRKSLPCWSTAGFDDSDWSTVRVGPVAVPGYENVPVPEARVSPPIRRTEVVPVAEVLTSPAGATIVDFGQNIGGRIRLRVKGKAGDRIVITHAEVLENGELCLRPLRLAKQSAVFDLADVDGEQELEVRFSSFGFRYAQIDGWPGEFDPAAIEAVVLHTDMPRRAWFESSDPLLNRYHENVVWSWRANTLSVPTDCPQRDERQGFTGDLQAFASAAATIYDADAFLTSWLRDLAVEQAQYGGNVPMMVPTALPDSGSEYIAGYGDASCVIPMLLWDRYGDVGVVRSQYASMKHWVDVVVESIGDSGLWENTPQFGDWLDPAAPPEDPGRARTDKGLTSTAALVRSLRLVADAAKLLGEDEDVARYGALAERSRRAFLDTFVTPAGRMMSDTPTAYTLAIAYDLVDDPEQRQAMGHRLAQLVQQAGYHIATGFFGTPDVCDALTDTGHVDVAERLLLQTESPSWLYQVTMGATTVWERWDSMRPDGTINPGEMVSFNHYAFGSVIDWMHRTVAGLAPDTPGYQRLRVAPRPLDGLDHAQSWMRTPYGDASVAWERGDSDTVVVRAVVPANTTAILDLPGLAPETVESGEHVRTFTASRRTYPGRYSVTTPTGEVIEDPRAYRALIDTVARMDVAKDSGFSSSWADDLRYRTEWISGYPLVRVLWSTPPETDILQRINEVLGGIEPGSDEPRRKTVAGSQGRERTE